LEQVLGIVKSFLIAMIGQGTKVLKVKERVLRGSCHKLYLILYSQHGGPEAIIQSMDWHLW
jgi:hypothetical protein